MRERTRAVSVFRCVAEAGRIVTRVALVLWMCAHSASAAAQDSQAESEIQRALIAGNAALAAEPPRPADARRAFDRVVAAGADRLAETEAHFRLGALDEADGTFARALTEYRACIASMPTSRWARNARQRITWLAERSEGEFKPLARLQLVNHDPSLANDPAAIDALATAAETFPAGRVRGEARLLVAETWLRRRTRSRDAVNELRKVLDDPHTERMTAAFAERDLVAFWLGDGELDDASREVQRYPFDRQSEATIRELLHKRGLRRGEILAGMTFLVGILFLWARRRRRVE